MKLPYYRTLFYFYMLKYHLTLFKIQKNAKKFLKQNFIVFFINYFKNLINFIGILYTMVRTLLLTNSYISLAKSKVSVNQIQLHMD